MSSSPVEYSIAPRLAGVDPYRDRRPPYSEDAEIAVLAAMLIDQDAVLRAVETVKDDSFYAEKHRRLFRADLLGEPRPRRGQRGRAEDGGDQGAGGHHRVPR